MIVGFLANFIYVVSRLMVYAIIFRIVISWFRMAQPMASRSPVEVFLDELTDPVLNLVKKLPHKIGMFDLSPIITIFGLDYLTRFIIIGLNSLL